MQPATTMPFPDFVKGQNYVVLKDVFVAYVKAHSDWGAVLFRRPGSDPREYKTKEKAWKAAERNLNSAVQKYIETKIHMDEKVTEFNRTLETEDEKRRRIMGGLLMELGRTRSDMGGYFRDWSRTVPTDEPRDNLLYGVQIVLEECALKVAIKIAESTYIKRDLPRMRT